MEKSKLISDEIIERVHRDNCFDFLRYLFAFSLILVHFCTLTETEQFWAILDNGQMVLNKKGTLGYTSDFLGVSDHRFFRDINFEVDKKISKNWHLPNLPKSDMWAGMWKVLSVT